MLGDSLAFGWGAGTTDTYPARLERRSRATGGRRVEVINAAFPGTCLGEKAGLVRVGRAPRFAPRAGACSRWLGDDVDGDLYWRVFTLQDGEAVRVRGPARAAAREPRAACWPRLPGTSLAGRALAGLHAGAPRAHPRAVARAHHRAGPAAGHAGARCGCSAARACSLLRAELRALIRLARREGSALAVVFVPFRQSVYGDEGWWADELRWKSEAVADAAATVSASHGVPFLDVTPALAAARARRRPGSTTQGAETHPTPAGYRAIAEEVAAWLDASGALNAR